MATRWISITLAAAVWACSSGGSGAGASGGAAPARRSGNLITQQEAASSSATNAWELVRQARPQWLITRGVASAGDQGTGAIQVYVDGVRRGGLDALTLIGIEQVGEIRFLDASDATTRYGTGHVHGAIEVRTRR